MIADYIQAYNENQISAAELFAVLERGRELYDTQSGRSLVRVMY